MIQQLLGHTHNCMYLKSINVNMLLFISQPRDTVHHTRGGLNILKVNSLIALLKLLNSKVVV